MVESNEINLDLLFPDPPSGKSHGGCAGCGTGKALADSTRCGNGLEKIYPTTAVRFGFMRYIGEFSHAPDMKFTCGAKVVIQTKRGMELGDQVSLTCHGCDKSVTRDDMRKWVDACGEDSYMFDAGRILREATAADLAEYTHIQAGNRLKRDFARRVALEMNLPLKIVDCEGLFGGERIIFFFTAEERIDFRELVKELAREYRTRIEMRQVGARDEARLLADFETCGREVCCKVFLKTLRPISMRMAKLQKATLDPSQVSGRCGRLKCCLRYEHMGYEELDKKLPRNGLRIRTNHGEGVTINRQVLTQLIQIRKDDGTIVTVVAEDITEVGVPPPPPIDPSTLPPPSARSGRRERPPRSQERRPLRSEASPPRRQSEGAHGSEAANEPTGSADSSDPSANVDDAGPSPGNEALPRQADRQDRNRDRDRGRRRRGRRRGPGGDAPRQDGPRPDGPPGPSA